MQENQNAKHASAYRKRQLESGKVFLQKWVKVENVQQVRDFADKLDAVE